MQNAVRTSGESLTVFQLVKEDFPEAKEKGAF